MRGSQEGQAEGTVTARPAPPTTGGGEHQGKVETITFRGFGQLGSLHFQTSDGQAGTSSRQRDSRNSQTARSWSPSSCSVRGHGHQFPKPPENIPLSAR